MVRPIAFRGWVSALLAEWAGDPAGRLLPARGKRMLIGKTERMIAIIDYGMANLRSVEKALARVGGSSVITGDPEVIARADRIVLPGVGAFCACMNNLNSRGLTDAVKQSVESGKPFLGICVGMQMLFESSSEMGINPGLGLIPGRVVKFFEEDGAPPSEPLKVPHIGWNELTVRANSQLLCGIDPGSRVYFVHSYYPIPDDPAVISATSDYGGEFCCAVETGNIAATQFHPEKSGAVGLQILRNFLAWNPVV
jgi:glutamine amidotransferase